MGQSAYATVTQISFKLLSNVNSRCTGRCCSSEDYSRCGNCCCKKTAHPSFCRGGLFALVTEEIAYRFGAHAFKQRKLLLIGIGFIGFGF